MEKHIHAVFGGESWLEGVGRFAIFLVGLVMMPFGVGVILWIALHQSGWQRDVKRAAQTKAEELGLNSDVYVEGSEVGAIIDKAQKKILFVSGFDHSVYPFSEVRGWEWQWIEKGGKKTGNRIVFKLNDEQNPLVRVGVLGSAQVAENWHNRLDLIINK